MHIKGIHLNTVTRTKQTQKVERAPVLRRDDSFASILSKVQQQPGLTFSRHAEQRLNSWGKTLEPEKVSRLWDAMNLAVEKGAKSTLVLMNDVAFVVAPQSKTVVTVIPEERMKGNIFTSIDSTVLVKE